MAKKNTVWQNILLIIFAILTTISFTLNIYNLDKLVKNISFTSTSASIESNLAMYGPFKVGSLMLLILVVFFYLLYKRYYNKNKKNSFIFIILAALFSLFMIFGYSYSVTNSWDLIFGSIPLFILSIFIFIGYFIFFKVVINLIYDFLIKVKLEEKVSQNKILNYLFNEHPFRSTFIILLICWLPYIIAFYPGILSPDPSNQIKQFFNLDTQYREYVVMIDENVPITNHHPVLHTVILGGLTYLFLGSANVGIFIYSLIQTGLLLTLLSYTMLYMKKLNTPYIIRIISLIIYAFVPIYPLYAMSTLKDVIFAILVIFYIIKLYECLKYAGSDYYNKKNIFILIILMLLITLFRNNGIYLILMSFPFLLFIDHKNIKKIIFTLLIPVICYYSFTNILLPYLKVTPGSIREVLSIPFQQTARYVKEYPDDVSEDERKAIDTILTYDTLAERYKPEISDPVKNAFNKYATKEDLKAYFKVWITEFFKHPNVYLEATINNTYGYFYPDQKKWYVYFNYDKRLKETGEIDYHYNNLKGLRKGLSSYASAFPYIPGIGSLVSIGFCTWICMGLFAFVIALKKYKYLIYFTPVISIILVCIASPVNTYFRYTLGYTFAIPLLISLTLNVINESKKEG